jgi:hypothetical protein
MNSGIGDKLNKALEDKGFSCKLNDAVAETIVKNSGYSPTEINKVADVVLGIRSVKR